MGQSLYRKYRPVTFDDVVGQTHIERTLRNAIRNNQLAHAYLFSGPRGTGKTTTARILAKALLCENGAPTPDPDGTCQGCKDVANGTHPDVIELDAASRTGVDNVREEIISRVIYAPVRGKSKVYIIDEVHMLSTGAFNAMLKTLEEPPSHVTFILCTTHPQKVPETIRSRCQQFDFHPLSTDDISARIAYIAQAEGVSISQPAISLIARHAAGGMRDALTELEQMIAFTGGDITTDDVEGVLGEVATSALATVAAAIATSDSAGCFHWVAEQAQTGGDFVEITRGLIDYMRDVYVLSVLGVGAGVVDRDTEEIEEMKQVCSLFVGSDTIAYVLDLLTTAAGNMRWSTQPRTVFEMALVRATRPMDEKGIEALLARVERLEKGTGDTLQVDILTKPAGKSAQVGVSDHDISSSEAKISGQPKPPVPASRNCDNQEEQLRQNAPTAQSPHLGSANQADAMWRRILAEINKMMPSRYHFFINTKAQFDRDGQNLVVLYASNNTFNMTHAKDAKNVELVRNAAYQSEGRDITVQFELAAAYVTPEAKPVVSAEFPPAPATQAAHQDTVMLVSEEVSLPIETADSLDHTPKSVTGQNKETSSEPPLTVGTSTQLDSKVASALEMLGATVIEEAVAESENALNSTDEQLKKGDLTASQGTLDMAAGFGLEEVVSEEENPYNDSDSV